MTPGESGGIREKGDHPSRSNLPKTRKAVAHMLRDNPAHPSPRQVPSSPNMLSLWLLAEDLLELAPSLFCNFFLSEDGFSNEMEPFPRDPVGIGERDMVEPSRDMGDSWRGSCMVLENLRHQCSTLVDMLVTKYCTSLCLASWQSAVLSILLVMAVQKTL